MSRGDFDAYAHNVRLVSDAWHLREAGRHENQTNALLHLIHLSLDAIARELHEINERGRGNEENGE